MQRTVRSAYDLAAGVTLDPDLNTAVLKLREVGLPHDMCLLHAAIEELCLLEVEIGPDLELRDIVDVDGLAVAMMQSSANGKHTRRDSRHVLERIRGEDRLHHLLVVVGDYKT